MNRTVIRTLAAGTALALAAVALAGCGASGSSSNAVSSAPAAPAGATNLAGTCPSTVVIQTDWNPEMEYGPLYAMLGKKYTVNTDKKSVSGTLMSQGKSTGVNLEIRAGGPAIGNQSVTSQLYSDSKIMLGTLNSDETIQNSAKQPTQAVFAPLEVSPQMIMWDPKTYPDVSTIAQLGQALPKRGGVVRYFDGSSFMSYLLGAGLLQKGSVDGSYDGTPANFVAAGGKDAQQGYSTSEPYIYEHEVKAWNKPVAFQLINDTGYPIYQGTLAGTPRSVQKNAACLKRLVPVMQQAAVDFIGHPSATVDLVLDLVKQYDNGWVYTRNTANYAVRTMRAEGIIANGSDGTLGGFDMARLQKVIDLVSPMYAAAKTAPKSGLTSTDTATNEFIDRGIHL